MFGFGCLLLTEWQAEIKGPEITLAQAQPCCARSSCNYITTPQTVQHVFLPAQPARLHSASHRGCANFLLGHT